MDLEFLCSSFSRTILKDTYPRSLERVAERRRIVTPGRAGRIDGTEH